MKREVCADEGSLKDYWEEGMKGIQHVSFRNCCHYLLLSVASCQIKKLGENVHATGGLVRIRDIPGRGRKTISSETNLPQIRSNAQRLKIAKS